MKALNWTVVALVILTIGFNLWDRYRRHYSLSYLNYATCPNCGDSYYGKPTGTIWYEPGRGVVICQECLNRPLELNIPKILGDLSKVGWKDNLDKVEIAITKYKQGD